MKPYLSRLYQRRNFLYSNVNIEPIIKTDRDDDPTEYFSWFELITTSLMVLAVLIMLGVMLWFSLFFTAILIICVGSYYIYHDFDC